MRDHQREHLAELERDRATFDHEQHLFPYLTLLRGKANAAADVRWAEQALALLDVDRARPAPVVVLAAVLAPAAPAAGRGTVSYSGTIAFRGRRAVRVDAAPRPSDTVTVTLGPGHVAHAQVGLRRARERCASRRRGCRSRSCSC